MPIRCKAMKRKASVFWYKLVTGRGIASGTITRTRSVQLLGGLNMLRRAGLGATLGVAALLLFAGSSNAQVAFGFGVGAAPGYTYPAYPYGCDPYVDPYCASSYAYGYYPYAYAYPYPYWWGFYGGYWGRYGRYYRPYRGFYGYRYGYRGGYVNRYPGRYGGWAGTYRGYAGGRYGVHYGGYGVGRTGAFGGMRAGGFAGRAGGFGGGGHR